MVSVAILPLIIYPPQNIFHDANGMPDIKSKSKGHEFSIGTEIYINKYLCTYNLRNSKSRLNIFLIQKMHQTRKEENQQQQSMKICGKAYMRRMKKKKKSTMQN